MAKSVKPTNNVYLDSSGITHNRELLSNIINHSLKTDNKTYVSRIGDFETQTFTVRNGGVYLYINSHVLVNCVMLIFTWTGNNIVKVLKIASFSSNSNDPIPTLSLNGNQLTITANSECRGYLYDFMNQMSV